MQATRYLHLILSITHIHVKVLVFCSLIMSLSALQAQQAAKVRVYHSDLGRFLLEGEGTNYDYTPQFVFPTK